MIKKVSEICYSKSIRLLLPLLSANMIQLINTMTLPQFFTILFHKIQNIMVIWLTNDIFGALRLIFTPFFKRGTFY